MRRWWVLALAALLTCDVHAAIALPPGVVLAIRVPMEVALVILAVVIVAAAAIWGFVGIMWWFGKRRTLAQLKSTRKEAEQQFKLQLPWKIDGMTTMTDVVANGIVLTCTFTVDTNSLEATPGLLESTKKSSAGMMFNREAVLQNMKLGAIYRYRYVDVHAKPLESFDLTPADFG